MAIIGKRNILSIVRASAPGLYLDGGELGEILLPGRYIPPDLTGLSPLRLLSTTGRGEEGRERGSSQAWKSYG